MPDAKTRLQNLLAFSVQIRHDNTDQVVGTGFLVSTNGHIVTCAHVVRDAGVDPSIIDGETVGVYSPHAGAETRAQSATVAACFQRYDDDVVLLQLIGVSVPLAPERIAVLGTADSSEGNAFQSYGFRRLGNHPSGRASGTILGHVAPRDDQTVQADPIELRTRDIRPGMSGAAVLDMERNLVVGVIDSRWNPGESSKNDNIGWAVDAHVLTLDPLRLPVRDAPHPLGAAPRPEAAGTEATGFVPRVLLDDAPMPIEEWVGRDNLLAMIDNDWVDPDRHVDGLIGFGGEGKSSLVRRWVDMLLENQETPQPDGVFWWNFYDNPSADKFFEMALTFIGGGSIDPRQYPSSRARAHLIAALLVEKRCIFVLDGLEVMQHSSGDSYGLLVNYDLSQFIKFFAAPGHDSFCLVTSRAPVLDLMNYTTYTHHDVERLSTVEGITLLRKLGVQGPDAQLEQLVLNWDGYALVLSLLGAYLKEWHNGDINCLTAIPAPTERETRYERVHRILCQYDEQLTDAERAVLVILGAFRTSIDEAALDEVLRTEMSRVTINTPVSALTDEGYERLLRCLETYRILRRNPEGRRYSVHPLIRAHYHERLTECERDEVREIHATIANYYLAAAKNTYALDTLEDLAPLIEAVYHYCQAGEYIQALNILYHRINLHGLIAKLPTLGASETNLALMLGFFPDGDLTQEPLAPNENSKYWILNEVGVCLEGLGRLGEALSMYQRAASVARDNAEWDNLATSYENMSGVYYHLGYLNNASEKASEARSNAYSANYKEGERNALAAGAWVAHLRGDLDCASLMYRKAEVLERRISRANHLHQRNGVQHADHLRRVGKSFRARRITEKNLELCTHANLSPYAASCNRLLGDLEAAAEDYASALYHYDEATKMVRTMTRRDVLIEVLLGRGSYYARQGEAEPAHSDLAEALGHATSGGYRIFEVDTRVALAWAHLATDNTLAARAEAERARRVSTEMSYYWGEVNAKEILDALED